MSTKSLPDAPALPGGSGGEYATTPYRFVVLLSFVLLQISNAMSWITFAPIATPTAAVYGVTTTHVNAFSVVFMVAYLPCTLLSAWVYTKFSLRVGLGVGGALTSVGCWIRVSNVYGGVLFGQILAAFGQPLIMNAAPKLAGAWFSPQGRALATTVGSVANLVGIALGQVFPTVFVDGTATTSGDVLAQIQSLLIFEAAYATAAAALAVALVRSRPETPPSASQALVDRDDEARRVEPFAAVTSRAWGNVVAAFRSKDFVALFVAFGLGLGIFNALTTLLEQMVRPLCFKSEDASLFGGLALGIGILGAVIAGVFLDKTHRYRLALRVGYSGGFILCVASTLAMQPQQADAIAALMSLFGLFVVAMLPTSFEAAVEATYPVPEDVSTGLLMTSGNVLGVAYIFFMGHFIDQQPPCTPGDTTFRYTPAYIIMIVSLAVAVVSIFFFGGSRKRLDAEAVPLVSSA